ncbi:glycosyltransferase family 2 protein [Demequina salsinemoris]|uniref:glycosyltransferase family 2 protein n=1 Tax=Demequina salsinemoris TaxID=577470 RepID=UPI000A40F4A0|nr:glycosyltransferase family 2 protein [Demequina salsinemoris]
MNPPPPVSFAMPVLNEEAYLREAVESILGQQDAVVDEVLLVLGRSTDRSDEIARELADEDSRIRLLRNERDGISRSINIALAEARNEIVIRVDAHAVLPVDYAAITVAALLEHGAANVGGRMHAEGLDPFQSAVAWAYNSPFGLGGAIYHVGGEAGPAESAYLGVFLRDAVVGVGGFDESLQRGEDWEMNQRLLAAGHTVWFEPRVDVVYRPRHTVRAVLRQFHASGRWRGEIIRRHPTLGSIRYFIPMTLVMALAASAVLLLLAAILGGGIGAVLLALGLVSPVVYGLFVGVAAAKARDKGSAVAVRVCGVLPLMHLSWGWGSLMGLLFPVRRDNAFVGR